ncbi:MAG: cyclic nucleotide-binding/CBS domain-containing protein [Candidatus Heimdallarchaeota archaeon]
MSDPDIIKLFKTDQCSRLIRTKLKTLNVETATIRDALNSLKERETDYVCLVDSNEQIQGLITERSILRWAAIGELREDSLASSIMEVDFTPIESTDSISKLVMAMYEGGKYDHMPVMEDGKLIGVVAARDFIYYLIDYYADSVFTVLPGMSPPDTREGA